MLLLRLLQFLYHLLLGRYISTTGQCFRILLIPHPSQELGGKSMITRSSAAAVCGYHQEERERDMYSYLCNRALAATCHATASNKTNKVKFVWVGLSCKPISLSLLSPKKFRRRRVFIFIYLLLFFLHFLMSFEEAPGKQIAIFKKGTHIHIHLGLPGCVCVLPFFKDCCFPRAMEVSDRIQQ